MRMIFPLLGPLWFFVCSLIFAQVYYRRKQMPYKEFLGLVAPKFAPAAILMVGYICLSAVFEMVERHAGVSDSGSWVGKYSGATLVLRIVALTVLAPVAEELFFRGAVFKHLSARGTAFAVFLSAAIFAGCHIQYSWLPMSIVFIDGLYYGFARAWSGSTLLTTFMHFAHNCLAVYQLLH